MTRQILSGDPRLTGPLAGQGYGGPLAPGGWSPDFSEADPSAIPLWTPTPTASDTAMDRLRLALPEAAARYRVSQWQPGVPQPGLFHDIGQGYGGVLGGNIADLLPQPPRTGPEAAMMFGSQLGIFAGPLAKTADLAALDVAKTMEKAGAHADDIWSQTGWGRGVDDKWRFEIPDNAAHASISSRMALKSGEAQQLPLARSLWHKPLYEAYPDLRKITVDANVPEGARGVSRGGTIGVSKDLNFEDNYRDVTLHEVQHEIQKTPEQFALGANPKSPTVAKVAHQIQEDAANTFDALQAEMRAYGDSWLEKQGVSKERIKNDNSWIKLANQAWKDRHPAKAREMDEAFKALNHPPNYSDIYWRHAGEVESRNVQKRMKMTPEERRATPPWKTEDVLREKQIIQMNRAAVYGGPLAAR